MACILIAEDDELRFLVMSEVLEMEGHTVFKALDGSEAWDLLQHHVVDLVLTNYEMPNLNGLELLKRLRVDQRYATLPVIVFTANDAEDLFMTHGATSVLLCPFDLPTYLEVVNRAIDTNAVSSNENHLGQHRRSMPLIAQSCRG